MPDPDLAIHLLRIPQAIPDATICPRSAGELRRALAQAWEEGRAARGDGARTDGEWLLPGVMRR